MKRILALIMAVTMLLTFMTSCSSREKFDFSNVNTIADLEGAIIAAQVGTFHLDALTDQTNGVTVKEYADFPTLLTSLNSGAIDGFVAEEPTALAHMAKDNSYSYIPLKNNDTGFTATEQEAGIAIAFRTGSEYVAQVNEILATIDNATRVKLMEQTAAMSANPDTTFSATLALSSSNTDTSNGTLKIAMECAYEPFNWSQMSDANGAVKIQGKDFYANGYDVQIAKYVAAELGMALEIYAEDWDSLIPGVNAGTYDGIIAGMSPTAEREEQVDFTDCYYHSQLIIIYKK